MRRGESRLKLLAWRLAPSSPIQTKQAEDVSLRWRRVIEFSGDVFRPQPLRLSWPSVFIQGVI